MEEFVVYVLFSKKFDRTYTGETSNLISRFKSHNKLGQRGWTLRYRPWIVILVEFYVTRKEALYREKYLKTGVGREWIKQEVYYFGNK
jgi:putative endonuclease